MDDKTNQFIKIIRKEKWLMEALKIARSLNLPDWYIAAGAIRNTIWDSLHNRCIKTTLNDIDVVYYDDSDLSEEKDLLLQEKLEKLKPEFKWEVVNQARAHLFKFQINKSRRKANSSNDSIAFWSETPTCIGVRLENDGSISIAAPHGINDLMNLEVRPVPEPFRDIKLYESRIKEKEWQKIWPKLKIYH